MFSDQGGQGGCRKTTDSLPTHIAATLALEYCHGRFTRIVIVTSVTASDSDGERIHGDSTVVVPRRLRRILRIMRAVEIQKRKNIHVEK